MVSQEKLAAKKAFTTFEVAEICDVTPVTIQNWIDKGWLQAYRTPGGHRRVQRDDLLEFLDSRNMPHIFSGNAGPPKVLIVDDEEEITGIIRDVLLRDNAQYEIQVAHDGFRAGVLYASFSPDVVILDLLLPGMDGFEVCREIKQSKSGGSTTVIAMSGYPDPERQERILALGATHFLQKPIDTANLRELVREASTARRGSSSRDAR